MVDGIGSVNSSSSWHPDQGDSETNSGNQSQPGNTTPPAQGNGNDANPSSGTRDDVTPQNSGENPPQPQPGSPTSTGSPDSSQSMQSKDSPAPLSRQTRQTQEPPAGSGTSDIALKPPVDRDPAGEFDNPDSLASYNALYQPSAANNEARLAILVPGPQGLQVSGCFGTTNLVMEMASSYGHEPQANLYTASEAMLQMYHRNGAQGHDHVQNYVTSFQLAHLAGYQNVDLPNHERWGPAFYFAQQGEPSQAVRDRVIEGLRQNFGANTQMSSASGQTAPYADMASIAFNSDVRRPDGQTALIAHIISVQRKFTTGDYRRDQYVVYDNNFGAFQYNGFGQMAHALSEYWGGARPSGNGLSMRTALVNYYTRFPGYSPQAAMTLAQSLNPNAGPGAGPQIEPPPTVRQPAIAPDPTLPPPAQGAMYGNRFPEDFKKRDAGDPTQPHGLFRPSIVSPGKLREQGGFSLEDTTLDHVNLNTHAGDLNADPKVFDSAGYLGTFRNYSAATSRLPGENGQATGYVYDVAPSPNMVDVDASLGGQRSSGEVAAMGGIDWAQVRGWQEVKNGVAGVWQRNPDYRWDVYDRTSTAGAQPQLAHYRPDDPSLDDPIFKPYVSNATQDGKTHTALTQDSSDAAAQFYVHARDRLKFMDAQTANRQNYRGALQIVPGVGPGQGNANGIYAYDPSATSWAYSGPAVRASGAEYQFTYGPDGRFHSETEPARTLRVNSDGQLFLGNLPDNPDSTNGVFEYTADHRLRHVEDGKYLSRGGYDGPVVVSSSPAGGASEWNVTDDHRHPLAPFSAQNPPSYRGNILIDPTDGHEVNHLYVSKVAQPASMQTYVGDSGNDSNNTNVRRFVYGDDGRFHDANDADRTLGVNSDGYLTLGKRPDNPASLNGVFRYENGRLIHAEDNKYLSRGGNQSAPYVSATDRGDDSKWAMKDGNGVGVTPPSVTLNDFNMLPPAAAHPLYRFNQDPDSALPAGTNRFVTQVPGVEAPETLDGNESGIADPRKAAAWLNQTHAAWLFQDGYYAVPAGADALEIRRIDGATVGHLWSDRTTGKAQWIPEQPTPKSVSRVPSAIWDWVRRDEASVNSAVARPPAM